MRKSKVLITVVLMLLVVLVIFDTVFLFKEFNKSEGSIKIYDESGRLIYEYTRDMKGYQSYVPLDSIPVYAQNAVIAAEDERFRSHLGIDPIAITRALFENIKQKRIVEGGSTITQQVVKANLYSKGMLKNRYIRKIREIYLSLALDVFYNKDIILEKYLNGVYLGNNSYGVEAASFTYFSKPALHLSLPESALLAGMISSPNHYDPLRDASVSMQRRNEVLELMKNKGYLEGTDLNSYLSSPLDINLYERPSYNIHFSEYAINEAMRKLDISDVKELSGYKIHTTYDSGLSEKAFSKAKSRIEDLSEEHGISNAALVGIRVSDGAIISMIGSLDYFNEDILGANNMALALRQPGSALKPITYAQAFYEGKIGPKDTILDEKTVFTDKNGKPFVPHNYNGQFNGEVPVTTALASSLNLPAVKVLSLIGVDSMVNAAHRLGITTLMEPSRYDLSVTLGGGEVTLLDLTNVYASFGRRGVYKEPYSVKYVMDSKDEKVYEIGDLPGIPVWEDRSEEISNLIFQILSEPSYKVLGFGRNNVLVLPFPIASKTGTTTDWHDNWTFGYTEDFSLGVWVGNADNSPMSNIDGVTGAGPIWRDAAIALNDSLRSKTNLNATKTTKDELIINNANEVPKASSSQGGLKITSPASGTVYSYNSSEIRFQRIAFEVSDTYGLSEDIYVEYYLDGNHIGKYPIKDSKYLWTPEEGAHVLESVFTVGSEGRVVKDKAYFTVNEEKP